MDLYLPPTTLLPFGMRAMKMIAEADGTFGAEERDLIQTAQRLFRVEIPLEELTPITPAELAAQIAHPALRKQLVRGMTLLTLIDGEASPEEVSLVSAFADAMEVDSADLEAIRHLAGGQMMRARFDVMRRFWAREKIQEFAKEKGMRWVASTLLAMANLKEDTAMAARYRALGECPEGSFGRGYFDFITQNEFSFPGERGSPPEPISLHDMTHVLSGYGTDPAGELQVLGFHAGCRGEEKDPFSFLLFGVVQFHMGVRLTPVAHAERGFLDPGKVLAAVMRGKACAIDPTDGWDPWPHMNRSLTELRDELGIPPAPA